MTETVLVVKGSKKYHTDSDCRGLQTVNKSVREWDRETAEAWDRELCKYCSGEFEPDGNKGATIFND